MASRNLNDLNPDLIPLANEFLSKCKDAGLNILVTCTYRSSEEQDELYSIGRTTHIGRKPVTNAKGGQSEHNFIINDRPASKAFDIVPLIDGECDWDEHSSSWNTVARIWRQGISNGKFWLDWYGRVGAPFREDAHF